MQFILAVIIILSIIFIHELGHFLAAKACGIGVVEFSVGMGPMLVGKRLGDTVYSLRAVPLGGYCAMWGENAAEASAQKKAKGPAFKTDWGEGRGFSSCARWKAILVTVAGPAANLLLGVLAALLLAGCPGVMLGSPEVVELGPVTVAQEAGVRVGDVIVSVDGHAVGSQSEFSNYMASHPETKDGYILGVRRPSTGEDILFSVVPDGETGLIGISHRGTELRGDAVLPGALRYIADTVKGSLLSVKMLATGRLGLRDMSGIVGITASMGDAMQEAETRADGSWLPTVLSMVVSISVGFAIVNMLPLPALDGGRALVATGEAVTRRKLPEKVELYVNGVGLLALCGLMLAIMLSDILKLVIA